MATFLLPENELFIGGLNSQVTDIKNFERTVDIPTGTDLTAAKGKHITLAEVRGSYGLEYLYLMTVGAAPGTGNAANFKLGLMSQSTGEVLVDNLAPAVIVIPTAVDKKTEIDLGRNCIQSFQQIVSTTEDTFNLILHAADKATTAAIKLNYKLAIKMRVFEYVSFPKDALDTEITFES